MRAKLVYIVLSYMAAVCGVALVAQDRETLVRNDIARFANNQRWVYNDFPRALQLARQSGKPIMVVLRCVPCEACSEFDQQVLEHEQELADLLDQFVCTRLIHMNGLDLSLFQFDFDQSLHILFLNADQVVYARFGTRSHRPEEQDMTLTGLRRAMERVLAWHAQYPENKQSFVGKRAPHTGARRPEEFSSLRDRYRSQLDTSGKIVPSCIHCHQVREAERLEVRRAGQTLSEKLLYPYPLPDVLGLQMHPDHCARIAAVEAGSPAAQAGLRPGDELESLDGQPLASIADIQWVLHHAPPEGQLQGVARRGSDRIAFVLPLAQGWRQASDISWRPTTWDLRRMALGGMRLTTPTLEELTQLGLPTNTPALYVRHVGGYGEHAVAKQAGFQPGDVIVAIDGKPTPARETDLIAYALSKPAGTRISATVRRGSRQLTLTYPTR
jgi:serine protease Do